MAKEPDRQVQSDAISSEAVLRILKLIFAGAPLPEVLRIIAQLIEAQGKGLLCTIWLLDEDGKHLRCATAPSLLGFIEHVGCMTVGPMGASCGTAVYRKEPVYVTDILSDSIWDEYRHLMLPYGIRAAWARPVLSGEGKVLGTFAILHREVQSPSAADLQLIEDAGNIVGIAIERHINEEELRRTEARNAAILDSALDCIVTIDHEGRITEFNPAAERTFGYRRDQVVGRHLADVMIPPSLRLRHREGLARYIATGEAQVIGKRVEMTALRADGSEFPVELAITRIPLDGPPSFTGYLRDITERKQSEEALCKARSELARVARATTLGALTASIAHEVNQPLSGIITNASTCLRMLAGDPPNVDGARETARRTIRDGNRASEVITRLRALFGKKDTSTESVDLNEAAREVIALSRSELQRSRVIVLEELADDLPPVTGDRVQLQQVMLNLLLNASDAMSGVEDRPRQLEIRTKRDEGDRVRVSVQDSGVGFEPQGAEKLFEAFYTTKSGGMGIGLSVSRSIIESHHGRLWAAPNEGPGATFSFSVPCGGEGATGAHRPGVNWAPAVTDAEHIVRRL